MTASIGDKLRLKQQLPYLKTADPMPMLRPSARQRMVAATDHLMLGSAIDTLRQRHDAIIAERDEVMSKAGYSAS